LREEEVAEILGGLPLEEDMGQAVLGAERDAGVVERAVGVEKLGADDADTGDAHPADHVLQPAGLEGFDVVVKMENQRGGGVGGA
jgi:hypothetical protein